MRTFVLFWLILLPLTMLADDVIVLNNGDIVRSKVIEIGQQEVKYKKSSNLNGPTYSMNKSEILSITYENGEKEVFNDPTNNEDISIIQVNPDNIDLINQYNLETPTRTGKSSNTTTNYAYVYYGLKDSSILSSDDVEISIERLTGKEYNALPQAANSLDLFPYSIKIRNKTTNPIYIDLGNTFRVNSSENGSKGESWYDGSIYSESHGSSSGASLGLGTITNTLGIGGIVGNIANGVSIGGSSQNGVTVDKSIQRIIVVPPLASINLPGHPYVDGKKIKYYYEWFDFTAKEGAKDRFNLKKWELREYDENSSPFNISYYITMSPKL